MIGSGIIGYGDGGIEKHIEMGLKDLTGPLNLINDAFVCKLISEKDGLILQRVNERAKLEEPFDLIEEAKRMFPRIKMLFDSNNQSEHWYWNDGSIDGLHLISFYPQVDFDVENRSYKAGFNYK